ncbi:hypothetical protein HUT16_08900 [Kitasatospora sp. NA04385]|uniref:hypothetical protein n=1 Tax=Kitasatospora sp. NA04385 TaxID=2742135 RepID=UPI001591C113|nr:hypothetical protein [Kitasatospora sp. NA04385]QKW19166.1 hypothetical protein HUT16_08900 [Kitasatospora sp. NA04385]
MTVPNTPAGSTPGPDPYPPVFPPPQPPARAQRPPLGPELRIGAVITGAGVVLGAVLGLLWLWLAPRVGYAVQDNHILYRDPEGEELIGSVGVFSLLGLGFGLLTSLGAFLWTRARSGGIAVAVGLAAGGLLGSVIAWQLGIHLGATSDLRAHARAVGDGGTFDGPLELTAKGALMVWPMTAMIVLLFLSATFGKREPDRPPYWATPGPVQAPGQEPGQQGPSLQKPVSPEPEQQGQQQPGQQEPEPVQLRKPVQEPPAAE